MKFTFSWLKEHLETNLTHCEIAEKLVSLGIEVEHVTDQACKFNGFVVGHIKEATQHPNADRLRVCQVDVGDETLEIVCGAPNARAGIRVIVARVGAIIPRNGTALRKGLIRGIESNGMMCSADELQIESNWCEDGIVELTEDATPGENPAKILGLDEIVFDVSLTPNRADCFCVHGIARDLAASGAGELVHLRELEEKGSFECPIDVEIQTDGCHYFSTIAIKNITTFTTPEFIAKRLRAIGQRLVFPPVDIANYVSLDIGQPLHIFDLDKLPPKLIVRDAKVGESLQTIDGKMTHLRGGETVITACGNEPLSVAGIMGGTTSAVSKTTRNVLIESALFDKVAIARAGQALRIISDARTRCERGVDPQMADYAALYVASLLGGECSICREHGTLPENSTSINVTRNKFMALTGLSGTEFENSAELLAKLGITVKSVSTQKITVETPSWRHDLMIEEDIIEEILRISGFDNINEAELERLEPKTQTDVADVVSDALVFCGYHEVKTLSFADTKTAEMFATHDALVAIKNPITVDFSVMRPTIILSHLEAIKLNQNKSQRNNRIFEIGRLYANGGSEVTESQVATATMSEHSAPRNWRREQTAVSVFDAKKDVERLLHAIIPSCAFRLQTQAPTYFHPGRCGTFVFQKDTIAAHFGEIHPLILNKMDIDGPVVCFELFLDNLQQFAEGGNASKIKEQPVLSQFQPTCRDFSFVVQKHIMACDIITTVRKLRLPCIRDISIFDVYEAEALGSGNKALAMEIVMQRDDATMSEEDIANASRAIIDAVAKNHGGTLRE